MRRLIAEHLRMPENAGRLLFHALAADEPPGKPFRDCQKSLVELSLEAAGDLDIWKTGGLSALWQGRVHRLTHEALRKDGFPVPSQASEPDDEAPSRRPFAGRAPSHH